MNIEKILQGSISNQKEERQCCETNIDEMKRNNYLKFLLILLEFIRDSRNTSAKFVAISILTNESRFNKDFYYEQNIEIYWDKFSEIFPELFSNLDYPLQNLLLFHLSKLITSNYPPANKFYYEIIRTQAPNIFLKVFCEIVKSSPKLIPIEIILETLNILPNDPENFKNHFQSLCDIIKKTTMGSLLSFCLKKLLELLSDQDNYIHNHEMTRTIVSGLLDVAETNPFFFKDQFCSFFEILSTFFTLYNDCDSLIILFITEILCKCPNISDSNTLLFRFFEMLIWGLSQSNFDNGTYLYQSSRISVHSLSDFSFSYIFLDLILKQIDQGSLSQQKIQAFLSFFCEIHSSLAFYIYNENKISKILSFMLSLFSENSLINSYMKQLNYEAISNFSEQEGPLFQQISREVLLQILMKNIYIDNDDTLISLFNCLSHYFSKFDATTFINLPLVFQTFFSFLDQIPNELSQLKSSVIKTIGCFSVCLHESIFPFLPQILSKLKVFKQNENIDNLYIFSLIGRKIFFKTDDQILSFLDATFLVRERVKFTNESVFYECNESVRIYIQKLKSSINTYFSIILPIYIDALKFNPLICSLPPETGIKDVPGFDHLQFHNGDQYVFINHFSKDNIIQSFNILKVILFKAWNELNEKPFFDGISSIMEIILKWLTVEWYDDDIQYIIWETLIDLFNYPINQDPNFNFFLNTIAQSTMIILSFSPSVQTLNVCLAVISKLLTKFSSSFLFPKEFYSSLINFIQQSIKINYEENDTVYINDSEVFVDSITQILIFLFYDHPDIFIDYFNILIPFLDNHFTNHPILPFRTFPYFFKLTNDLSYYPKFKSMIIEIAHTFQDSTACEAVKAIILLESLLTLPLEENISFLDFLKILNLNSISFEEENPDLVLLINQSLTIVQSKII